MISCKGTHVPQDILLTGVRWDITYPWNYRHVEALMEERGMRSNHAICQRWDVQDRPQPEEAFHHRKRPVWISWRMDETSITVKGEWRYRYRAVETHSKTSDFLLTEQRDAHVPKRFLTEAAPSTLRGIALMPMLRKGQLENGGEQGLTADEQCYALASSSANQPGVTSLRSATHQYLRHNSHAPLEPHHP